MYTDYVNITTIALFILQPLVHMSLSAQIITLVIHESNNVPNYSIRPFGIYKCICLVHDYNGTIITFKLWMWNFCQCVGVKLYVLFYCYCFAAHLSWVSLIMYTLKFRISVKYQSVKNSSCSSICDLKCVSYHVN